MLQFIRESGPYIFPLCAITGVVIYLAIHRGIKLFSSKPLNTVQIEGGLNALIFWGCFSAVLGFLGQWSGMYKGLDVLVHAEKVNPRLVVMGLKESLSTSVYGMTLLLVSGILWFVLNWQYRRRTRRTGGSRSEV